MEAIIFWLVVGAIWAALCLREAYRKGLDPTGAVIAGIFFGFLALLYYAALPYNVKRKKRIPVADLEAALSLHKRWLEGDRKGKRLDLSHENIMGAKLNSANLSGAKLLGADLSFADLSNANLSNANFLHADLSGANLTGTKLGNANLLRADLSDATLSGVDLVSTNLTDVKGYIKQNPGLRRLGVPSPVALRSRPPERSRRLLLAG
jgi:uncharacterized protein YjbI with pentapeptide repeats